MSSVNFIEHRGKRILFMDISGNQDPKESMLVGQA